MDKHRLEAFSDGVFAIVITLLVLDIHLPERPVASNQLLLTVIQSVTPNVLTFVFTFLVVGIFWVAHHRIFDLVKAVDPFLLWGNILYLMTIAIIPFPASLLAKHPTLSSAILIYTSVLFIIGIQHFILLGHISRRPALQHTSFNQALYQRARLVSLFGPVCYIVAGLTSLVNPIIGFIFILLPLVFYIGFSSRFYRRL